MRIFVAGGSGILSLRVVPLLVAQGHTVAAMTRSLGKVSLLERLGAIPVVCDVFDKNALCESVVSFDPGAVFHSLTNLPDDPSEMAAFAAGHLRILREGTDNLVVAVEACASPKLLEQSVAWQIPSPVGEAYQHLEQTVLGHHGSVVRYGKWYGPDTWGNGLQLAGPQVHIDTAAQHTIELFDAPPGVYTIVDDNT